MHPHGPAGGGAGPERLRSVRVALGVNVALVVAKLLAFWATGFVVLLAEVLHSVTDAIQAGFLLVAARLSARPADEAHPFGHGRGENLAAVVIAVVFVFFVAWELVREALDRLASPGAPPTQPLLALGVLLGSAAVMVWPLVLARRDMHREGGVVRALAMETLNDLLGVLAAAVGIALVMAGVAAADAVAAMVVAAIIVYNAIQLFRANLPFLIGGSPSQEFYREVESTAKEEGGVLGVHSMAAEFIGPNQVHLDMSITVPDDLTIDQADEVAHRVRHRLAEEMGVRSLAIHFCTARGELRRAAAGNAALAGPARLAPGRRRRAAKGRKGAKG